MTKLEEAIEQYKKRNNLKEWHPQAALIDMDGVLYDSMPGHARAWKRMMDEQGVPCTQEEFFLYEGMTGRATIDMLMRTRMNKSLSTEEIDRLYAIKSEYFKQEGRRLPMPGAAQMLSELQEAGIKRVLVTGSAQHSLLESLNKDYPGAFLPEMRVTALDVKSGKPNPEPYLKGLEKAGCDAFDAMVIENAPLGVQAGRAAGCFTIALCTGPIPAEKLYEAGADIVYPSMQAFANSIAELLQ